MLSTVPGLDDVQVRKAIATAMPRQQIVDRVVKDANDKADGARQPHLHGRTSSSTSRTGTSTRRRATSTRPTRSSTPPAGCTAPTACGQKDGVKLAFTRRHHERATRPASSAEQIIQQQLKKIGVKLTIKNAPDILDIEHRRRSTTRR